MGSLRWIYLTATTLAVVVTIAIQKGIRPQLAKGSLAAVIAGTLPSLLYSFGLVLFVAAIWPKRRDYLWWALLGTTSYELVQPLISVRTFDALDVVSGAVGGLLAIAIARRFEIPSDPSRQTSA